MPHASPKCAAPSNTRASISSTTRWLTSPGKSAHTRAATRAPIECPTSTTFPPAWRACASTHAATSAASAAGVKAASSPTGVEPCPRRSTARNDGEGASAEANRATRSSHVPEWLSRPCTKTTRGGRPSAFVSRRPGVYVERSGVGIGLGRSAASSARGFALDTPSAPSRPPKNEKPPNRLKGSRSRVGSGTVVSSFAGIGAKAGALGFTDTPSASSRPPHMVTERNLVRVSLCRSRRQAAAKVPFFLEARKSSARREGENREICSRDAGVPLQTDARRVGGWRRRGTPGRRSAWWPVRTSMHSWGGSSREASALRYARPGTR